MKRLLTLVMVSVMVALGLAGCKKAEQEHPAKDHPSKEHPAAEKDAEKATSEHPTEHPE